MSKVTIHGFAGSTYVRTARMVCEEKGIDYELSPVDYGSDSHGELHPFRRMPSIDDGDVHLFEALAVGSYLDRSRNGGTSLQPDEPEGHARMLQWISAINDYLYPDLVRALLKEDGATEDELSTARSHLEQIDATLQERPYLAGDELTLADLFLAPIDAFAESGLTDSPIDEGLEGLAAWRERVRSRPSFKATAA